MSESRFSRATRILTGAIFIAAWSFAGCRQDMHDQPKYIPLRPMGQVGSINDGRSARPLVEGTIPREDFRDDAEFFTGRLAGFEGAPRATQGVNPPSGASSQSTSGALQAATSANQGGASSSQMNAASQPPGPGSGQSDNFRGFVTEFPMQITEKDLDRGQERFNIYCAVCHGPLGDGGGMIPKRGFRKPPSYHDDRLRNAPVGYFFDVITNGFGTMPDYATQVEPADRWRIIAYIRALQLSQNARISDVPQDRRDKLDQPQQGAASNKEEK